MSDIKQATYVRCLILSKQHSCKDSDVFSPKNGSKESIEMIVVLLSKNRFCSSYRQIKQAKLLNKQYLSMTDIQEMYRHRGSARSKHEATRSCCHHKQASTTLDLIAT